ncbi:hypothetical protein B0J17DRAFT_716896 [Rhizoctonia solani]|nr:hypothetical protein B0J17DRAFT_716896 [Rhizoctonia solani]
MRDNLRRVVEIAELLTLIADEFDIDERRELMLVSKHFFRCVGPDVWKSVPRIDFLMELIAAALDGRPPLPNLRQLTTYTGVTNISDTELMGFINMFFSPSLTGIRTLYHEEGVHTYINSSSIPAFFKKIREICPQIRTLEFYPQNSYNSSELVTLSEQSRNILQSFSNLRSFTSAAYILESATFGVLGSLPRLELLGIRGSHISDPVLDEQLSTPADWFEELIALQLYDIHPQDIKILWRQPSVVKKLGSVLIQTDLTTVPNVSGESMDGNSWVESFLGALPRLSPHLHDLTFYVGDEDGTEFQISQDVRDGLRKLDLDNLELKLKKTYGVDEDSDDEQYEGYYD